jgi:hypothetical protein
MESGRSCGPPIFTRIVGWVEAFDTARRDVLNLDTTSPSPVTRSGDALSGTPTLIAALGAAALPRARSANSKGCRAKRGHLLRVRLGPQRMGRSLEKMLKLMVEADPGMFVLLEKGYVRRRKVRVDKSAYCYTYDPGRDLPFPKQ